ncbi:MAG: anthranilate phosphoribosyltransferase [Actinobacteria bacterium]|nr:anthranilate phosphoribosyltransferase [Actinomycetota bacterium]
MTWDEIHNSLHHHENLTTDQVRWAMNQILSGEAKEEDIRQFLLGLKAKGESVTEVVGLVDEMYEHANLIEVSERAVDPVGTGGDGFNTINISTAAAIVTTAAGARVIKHGNRAATSKSGAADVLEALGIAINLNAAQVAESVRKIGIGFAFAPNFHPAMRFAAPVRKSLGTPTIFNILGPLANPAQASVVSIGVAREEMLELIARVLAQRGCEGFVFRGDEGLDEISVSGKSTILSIHSGAIERATFDPREIGIESFEIQELAGGDAETNARAIREVFEGRTGAQREAILLNAAAAIAAFRGDFDLGIEQQIANGYVWAKSAIDSGKALQLLERWADLSTELAKSSL